MSTTQSRQSVGTLTAQVAVAGADTIVADTYANADDWWRDCAWRAVDHMAAAGVDFTAADLTELGVPDPDVPNRWGALFRAALTAGVIVPVGFVVSSRPSRHGGVCRVWRGAEHAGVAR